MKNMKVVKYGVGAIALGASVALLINHRKKEQKEREFRARADSVQYVPNIDIIREVPYEKPRYGYED